MKAIQVTNGDEWHTLYEALGQYVENQQDYLDSYDDADVDPEARKKFEIASKMLESMDAQLIALTENPRAG